MPEPSELELQRQRMMQDWEQRARQDAEKYVYTRDLSTDEANLVTSGRINFEQLVRPFLPALLRGRPPRSCRVVEIGCGLGRMTRWLAEAFLEVHAVDISPQMVQQAGERLRDCPNIALQVNSGTDLAGLESDRFDLVFSYLVFQHIPSRAVIENYLREAARVLQPGGAILFQVNGDWTGGDPQQAPNTWVGERFSLAEIVQLLRQAGFQPITATGAGTQYLLVAARKMHAANAPLACYLLPGAAAPPEQLLEGWERPAADGYRPIGPRCRILLAMPDGPERRFFLSVYFPPREPFPGSAFTVRVNDAVLQSVRVDRSGDHYFEWELPSGAAVDSHSRAVVSLEFAGGQSPCLPWVRSMGFFPQVAYGLQSDMPPGEIEERIAWTRELEAQLAVTQEQLQDCRREARQLRASSPSEKEPHPNN